MSQPCCITQTYYESRSAFSASSFTKTYTLPGLRACDIQQDGDFKWVQCVLCLICCHKQWYSCNQAWVSIPLLDIACGWVMIHKHSHHHQQWQIWGNTTGPGISCQLCNNYTHDTVSSLVGYLPWLLCLDCRSMFTNHNDAQRVQDLERYVTRTLGFRWVPQFLGSSSGGRVAGVFNAVSVCSAGILHTASPACSTAS
jgi:hypothetical protein